MAKRGINREQIMDMAQQMVEEKGYENFSLRELAARLEIKPASLYNHIKGLDEIYIEIALRSAHKLNEVLKAAVDGKAPDDAFMAGTRAYREFALSNPELYKAFVRMPLLNDETVRHAGIQSFLPLRELIISYGTSKYNSINFSRALRSAMHGFIELTNNGFMQRGDITQDESYDEMMKNYLNVLKSYKDRER